MSEKIYDLSLLDEFIKEEVYKKAPLYNDLEQLKDSLRKGEFFAGDYERKVVSYLENKKDIFRKTINKSGKYYRARLIEITKSLDKLNEYKSFIRSISYLVVHAENNKPSELAEKINSVSLNDTGDLNELLQDGMEHYLNSLSGCFLGFDIDGCGAPPDENASAGRCNIKGKSVLYLSKNKTVALWELKPSVGQYISLGEFLLKKDLQVYDFTFPKYKEDYPNKEDDFLNKMALSYLFSIPTGVDDDAYLLTQYITECVRREKMDGIIFSSSIVKDNNNNKIDDNINMVLFETNLTNDLYEVVGSEVYLINSVGDKMRVLPPEEVYDN